MVAAATFGSTAARADLAPVSVTTSTASDPLASVDDSTLDPLHSFCYGSSSCSDNGTNTPVSTDPPQFGFTISPGPQTGNLLLELLVPDTGPAAPLNLTVTESNVGKPETVTFKADTGTSKSSAWTGGTLEDYLGYTLKNAPTNGIGAYLPSTDKLVPAATGFYVYQATIGTTTVQANSSASSGPLFSLSGGIAKGSYIVAYLQETCGYISTANSGALFETGHSVPEPAALVVLAGGLGGLAWLRRRKGLPQA